MARSRGRPFQKGNPVHGSRKGIPNKMTVFKASIRDSAQNLTEEQRDQVRASFVRGLLSKPELAAKFFAILGEYVDGKPKGEGDGPPPGSFFQIVLSKPVTEDPLAYRYESKKALPPPEESIMVVLPDEPEAPQKGKAVRRRAKGDGRPR